MALSGGADSVSLLLVMHRLSGPMRLEVEAAHCNFHLRGDESLRDERFCKDLCARLGIRLHLAHFATRDYAEAHHVSIEMAARDLRYKYFEDLRRDTAANDICVAHHRDDSVETVLLNLVRGTGVRGLRGIQPRNVHIVRPMLCVSRQDILHFLAAEGQDYVTDSTNLINDVKRNKIRLDVIPLLRQLNPNVCQSIFDTSLNMCEAFKVYDDAMGKSMNDVCGVGGDDVDSPVSISVERLLAQPSAESTLFSILGKRGFTSSQIAQISASVACRAAVAGEARGAATMASGKVVSSSTHELLFNRGSIIVQPVGFGVSTKAMRIPEPGTYVYSADRKFRVAERPIDSSFAISRGSMCVSVDADKVRFPLTIRPTRPGERFVPFGMSRSKLVSDFLTDRKLTLFDKRRQLVVADAADNVIWLVGERADNRARITPASTKALLIGLEQS